MRSSRVTWLLVAVVATAEGCKTPAQEADASTGHGLALANKGDYDGAIQAYDRAITLNPVLASAYRYRGVAYAHQEDYDRAIRDLDEAIKLQPDQAGTFNSRGVAYQSRGDYARAIEDYGQALTLKPDHALALKNRGRSEFYLGRFAESAADLQRGLAYDSTNAYVVIWLHLANSRLGRGDTLQFVAQLARTDPVQWPAPVARYYLGRMTADQLVAAAVSTDSNVRGDQRCAAEFYIGESALLRRQTHEATRRFQAVRANCPHSWTEYQGAVAELGRLGGARP